MGSEFPNTRLASWRSIVCPLLRVGVPCGVARSARCGYAGLVGVFRASGVHLMIHQRTPDEGETGSGA